MNTKNKIIWIDLDNSPHVPLFAPIIRHYRANGVEVVLTARDHSQTIELLELNGFGGSYETVGKHYGKSKINKLLGLLVRAKQLVSYINKLPTPISVAVSHGSRSMVLAAKWLKIPVITMYDYEWTETRIFNRLSDKVIVPDAIPEAVLDEVSLPVEKRFKYAGIKEELYMREFQPAPDFRRLLLETNDLNGGGDKILAVLRPPASTANYHSAKSEDILNEILKLLLKAPEVITAIVPRTAEQSEDIKKTVSNISDAGQNCIVLNEAVNGLDLAFAADMLISGGGTMNREAVLLGVPVYSIFAGRQGSLDDQMEKEGKITFIRNASDLKKIKLVCRTQLPTCSLTGRVEKFVIEQIDSLL